MKLYYPPKTDILHLDVWLERLVKELEPYLIDSPTFTGQATIPTIDLTGGQIAFPATAVPSADPNTLDDYEEGGFTLGMFDASGGGNEATYTVHAGKYVKIGKCVHFIIVMEIAGVGGMTGANDAFFRDLPFPVGTIAAAYDQTGPVYLHNVTFNGTPVIEIQAAGGEYFKIAEVTSGTVVDYVTVAEFGTGCMYVTGTYFI